MACETLAFSQMESAAVQESRPPLTERIKEAIGLKSHPLPEVCARGHAIH